MQMRRRFADRLMNRRNCADRLSAPDTGQNFEGLGLGSIPADHTILFTRPPRSIATYIFSAGPGAAVTEPSIVLPRAH